MMDFELKLEKPKWFRKYVSAGTMGFSYLIGISSSSLPPSSKTDDPRWSHSDDPLLRHVQRHPRPLRLHWHHGRRPPGLRIHQELGHGWHEAVCVLRLSLIHI